MSIPNEIVHITVLIIVSGIFQAFISPIIKGLNKFTEYTGWTGRRGPLPIQFLIWGICQVLMGMVFILAWMIAIDYKMNITLCFGKDPDPEKSLCTDCNFFKACITIANETKE